MGTEKTIQFNGETLNISIVNYENNNRKAIHLSDRNGEPYAVASVNMSDIHLEENEVIIKDYSENEGIDLALIEAGIVVFTGKFAVTGFVSMPICRILI